MTRTLTDADLAAIRELVTPAPPARMLTTSDVAELLSVTEDFVRAHARDLGAVKVGGLLRFDRGRLERALEAHRLWPRDPLSGRRRPGPQRLSRSRRVPLIPIPEDV